MESEQKLQPKKVYKKRRIVAIVFIVGMALPGGLLLFKDTSSAPTMGACIIIGLSVGCLLNLGYVIRYAHLSGTKLFEDSHYKILNRSMKWGTVVMLFVAGICWILLKYITIPNWMLYFIFIMSYAVSTFLIWLFLDKRELNKAKLELEKAQKDA